MAIVELDKELSRRFTFTVHKADSNEVRVYIGTSGDEKELRRCSNQDWKAALKAGHAVSRDGIKWWRVTETDWVNGDYVWHEDSDRVACTSKLIRYVEATGERTESKLRTVWRRFNLI